MKHNLSIAAAAVLVITAASAAYCQNQAASQSPSPLFIEQNYTHEPFATQAKGALELLKAFPCQSKDRVEPLDTRARQAVYFITGTQRFEDEDPLVTLLSLVFESDRWQTQWKDIPLVVVGSPRLRRIANLPEGRTRATYAEGSTLFAALTADAQSAGDEEFAPFIARMQLVLDAEELLRIVPPATSISTLSAGDDAVFFEQENAGDVFPDDADHSDAEVPQNTTADSSDSARQDGAWSVVGPHLLDVYHPVAADNVTAQYQAMGEAFRREYPQRFSLAVLQLKGELAKISPRYYDNGVLLRLEVAYNEKKPFFMLSFAYLSLFVLLLFQRLAKNKKVFVIAMIMLGVVWVVQTVWMVIFSILLGRLPLKNVYEFTLSLMWVLVPLAVFYDWRAKREIFITVTVFLVFAGLMLAHFLPLDMRMVSTLPPILTSGMLQFHVVVMILAYASLTLSFGLSIVYIGKYVKIVPKFARKLTGNLVAFDDVFSDKDKETLAQYAKAVSAAVKFGFLLLTLGIITGAIWANQAWGRFWGWDPKETWALVTWIIYAAYLYMWVIAKKRGIVSIMIAVAGFALVIFTFLGVHFLLPSLHGHRL